MGRQSAGNPGCPGAGRPSGRAGGGLRPGRPVGQGAPRLRRRRLRPAGGDPGRLPFKVQMHPHRPGPRDGHRGPRRPPGGGDCLPKGGDLLRPPAPGPGGVHLPPGGGPGPAGLYCQRHGLGPERPDGPLRREGGPGRRGHPLCGGPRPPLSGGCPAGAPGAAAGRPAGLPAGGGDRRRHPAEHPPPVLCGLGAHPGGISPPAVLSRGGADFTGLPGDGLSDRPGTDSGGGL